jgi:nitrate/nitrite transporter NarK
MGLSLALAGVLSALVIFWAMPTALLSGRAAASGIALINSVGNLGGYLSPWTLGWLKEVTYDMHSGFLFIAALLTMASLVVLQLFNTVSKLINKW